MIAGYMVPDELLVRLYRWARADFQREIEEGFPLIREVDGRTTYALLGVMESLSEPERSRLASYLLKRHHQRAVEVLGEDHTTDGQEVFEQELANAFRVINHFEQERAQRAQSLGRLLGGYQVRQAVIKQLKKELVEPDYAWPEYENWPGEACEVVRDGFRIMTFFFRSGDSFIYHHLIQSKETEPGVLDVKKPSFFLDRLHLFNWLGISQATPWSQLRLGDVERVARHVARLCRHFIKGVGPLLDDKYL
jgi:hypothetical protein